GAAGEHAQRAALIARMLDGIHLPQPHRGAEVLLFDQGAVAGTRAARLRALEDVDQEVGAQLAHTCVPPTVMPSMRIVGRPTPTGTDCRSLPQAPTPSSSLRSWPPRITRVRA